MSGPLIIRELSEHTSRVIDVRLSNFIFVKNDAEAITPMAPIILNNVTTRL